MTDAIWLPTLRFVSGIGVVSDLIKKDTGGRWSHVEAVTSDGKYLGAHADGGAKRQDAFIALQIAKHFMAQGRG
jgi:hypothetical protein